MERFQANEYLTKEVKHELAMALSMKEISIANWYSKMRQKKAADEVSRQSK